MNPNFLLAHRNRYSEGMNGGQKTPRGHPDFNSYVKILRVFIFQIDEQKDRDISTLAARGLEALRVNLLLKENSYVSNIILHRSLILEFDVSSLGRYCTNVLLVRLTKVRC